MSHAPETLSTDRVRKVYRGRAVVSDVSIEVRPGEIVGLLGPNGAGKTTTFYMVVGMTQPDSGRVYFGDEEITDLPMYLRAKRGISYLPQEPSVFRGLSVEDNIRAIFETANEAAGARGQIRFHAADDWTPVALAAAVGEADGVVV